MKNKGSKESVSMRYVFYKKTYARNLDSGKCVLEMFFRLPPQGIRPSNI